MALAVPYQAAAIRALAPEALLEMPDKIMENRTPEAEALSYRILRAARLNPCPSFIDFSAAC
jgi:hypothetical protein